MGPRIKWKGGPPRGGEVDLPLLGPAAPEFMNSGTRPTNMPGRAAAIRGQGWGGEASWGLGAGLREQAVDPRETVGGGHCMSRGPRLPVHALLSHRTSLTNKSKGESVKNLKMAATEH